MQEGKRWQLRLRNLDSPPKKRWERDMQLYVVNRKSRASSAQWIKWGYEYVPYSNWKGYAIVTWSSKGNSTGWVRRIIVQLWFRVIYLFWLKIEVGISINQHFSMRKYLNAKGSSFSTVSSLIDSLLMPAFLYSLTLYFFLIPEATADSIIGVSMSNCTSSILLRTRTLDFL